MAVQKTGNYLFVVRNETNELRVVHKTTGALIRNITLTGIMYIAIDMAENLWVTSGSTIEKYTVNTDGTITSLGITLSGNMTPAAIAVSPDNTTVVVADGHISQQVLKGFSNSSGGSALWNLGTLGGYMTDATVTNDKFYFHDVRQGYPVSIAFESDGSFWVSEFANFRIQHYSSSRTFINRISYIGGNLFVGVDPNDASRLYRGFYEYALDNAQVLDNGQNGSWVFSKNWGAVIGNDNFDSGFGNISSVFSVSNHTYCCIRGQGTYDIFELVQAGVLRKTKQSIGGSFFIRGNGQKILSTNGHGVGIASQYLAYNITGLDVDNDPLWSSTPSETITSPVLGAEDPNAGYGTYTVTPQQLIYFQSVAVQDTEATNYHLAAFVKSSGKWTFKTSPGTSPWYSGDFPSKGEFDNGNGVERPHAGSYMEVNGSNIVWTYRGEFWKQQQANFFNHFHMSGLFIGLFGRDKGGGNDGDSDPAGAEGNAFTGSWVQHTQDKAFMFSGGEGLFAGIHRWSIEGLSSVHIQTCTFNASLQYPVVAPDLMQGLVHGQELVNGNGWTLSHPSTPFVVYQKYFNVLVGTKTASKYGSQDISIKYNAEGYDEEIRSVSRVLPNAQPSNNWKLSTLINLDGYSPAHTDQGGYVQVLDHVGKVIAQLYITEPSQDNGITDVRVNGLYMQSFNLGQRETLTSNQPYSVHYTNGTLTFVYAKETLSTTTLADPSADPTRPTTFRLYFTPSRYYPRGREKAISVAEFRFITQ